ncbi:MAG: D-alanyl-D-alanine carboxypeptidase, partial [Clostridia bacterium]|nr:D-alanyl-D-alanine carboxypeptidase [Clostridia bacterium]
KLYSLVMFMIIAIVLVNSVGLLSANSENSTNSIKSILKNANFEKHINVSKQDEEEPLDEDFTYDAEEETMAVQSARGGVLIEQSTRRVLLDEDMHIKCYPASTTKVLTALVVLNNLPLDRVVKVPKAAEGVEGSSIYLRAGQKITVEDLLFGLMLRSGNDAAVALAIETAGSVENFALMMNETATMLGAHNSHFVNPHGLHDDNHYTTAYDLAMITASAYENEDFVRIVSSKKAKITVDGVATYIGNKNKLLTLYEGANGVKTGYTKRSGRCLVGGASRDGMQLITVVFNYNDMWNDTIRMLNYGFDNYEMKPIDNTLLEYKKGLIPIEFDRPFGMAEGQFNARYPLRRDGSEYIELKVA